MADTVLAAGAALTGGGRAAAVTGATGDEEVPRLEEILSRDPSPEFAALAAEEHRRLLHLLGDEELREVARLRLEGYSVEEIAPKVGYASRSIKRKLRLIRGLWEKDLLP